MGRSCCTVAFYRLQHVPVLLSTHCDYKHGVVVNNSLFFLAFFALTFHLVTVDNGLVPCGETSVRLPQALDRVRSTFRTMAQRSRRRVSVLFFEL
jgi:hypothetical protein